MFNVLAGTCDLRCWTAKENVCHCMCNGINHGIMRCGGEQPGRYCRRKGVAYELVAIVENWLEARKITSELSKEYNAEHGLEWWRESAFHEKATGSKLRWPEVQMHLANQTNCKSRWGPESHLIWRRIS